MAVQSSFDINREKRQAPKLTTDLNYPARSREFLFILDARDSVPNGEREPGVAGPRIDSKTGKALITDICLKRIVREYFLKNNSQNNRRIMSRQDLEYSEDDAIQLKDLFLNDLGKTEVDLKKMDADAIYTALASSFLDHRLFGSLTKILKKLFAVTGPVQMEITSSMNVPRIVEYAISSTMASEGEKSAGALGRNMVLDYAIFAIHGIVKQKLAKISRASEQDVLFLYEGLWEGIKAQATRTRVQLQSRLILALVMKDPRKQIVGVRKSICLDNEKIRSFQDCILNIDELVNLITINAKDIEEIEIREDPGVRFIVSGKIISSIIEIAAIIHLCPPIKRV